MRFSELDGLTIGVWGLGREIRSFLRHVAERLPAARVAVVVLDDPTEAPEGPVLDGTRVAGPADAGSELARCDVLVRSPGVSIHKPVLAELIAGGLAVTTATGLWLAERRGERVIGITGTKGKSTTATLLAHLAGAQRPTTLAGNIGLPALDLLDAPAEQWVVLELSSYQTADLAQGPEVAVITNLYKEHTDWHGDEATYRAEKLRLFTLPGVAAAVHPAGFPAIDAAVAGVPRRVRFGTADGWHVSGGGVRHGDGPRLARSALPLRGEHNALNLCAALSALDAAGFAAPELPQALAGVAALPHRLETVWESGGVAWVDDSISTTPESALAALAAFAGVPVVLIAGGLDRGQEYAALGGRVAAGAVALVTLPETGDRLAEAALADGLAPERLRRAGDMDAAVAAARELVPRGGVVLLSPAAPSYITATAISRSGATTSRRSLASDRHI